jgi:hypothetical protein
MRGACRLQAAREKEEWNSEGGRGKVGMFAHVSWRGRVSMCRRQVLVLVLLLPSAHQLKLIGRTFRLIHCRN